MSIKTWVEEFNPDAAKQTRATALDHTIKKWSGLTPEALEKHKLVVEDGLLVDGDNYYAFDSSTCALCVAFMGNKGAVEENCEECPLAPVILSCSLSYEWVAWSCDGNPQLMKEVLAEAKQLIDDE